jgi:hypothetical protein
MTKSYLSTRCKARITAEVLIEGEPSFSGSLDRYSERLDSEGYAHLKYSTILGAVRAAARKLGRYDAKTDSIKAQANG